VLLVCVDWLTQLLEWAAAMLLVLYGVVAIGMLLVPQAWGVSGISGRVTLISTSSSVIIPLVITVFVFGWIEDKLVNDGNRYATQTPVADTFDRL